FFIQATQATLVVTILPGPLVPPNPQLAKANTSVTGGIDASNFISNRLIGFQDLPGSTIIMTQGVTVSQSVIQSFAGLTGQLTVTGTVGTTFQSVVNPNYTIQASGNPNVFGFDPATPLPGGLTLDTRTGIISGIPTDVGAVAVVVNVTITATNGFATGSNTL